MKLKTQSQLVAFVRGAMQLSAVGIAGLSLLTSSVEAQEAAPAFAPGQPFSRKIKPKEAEVWVPPATEVQAAPVAEKQSSPSDWTPPETPVVVPPEQVIVEEAEPAPSTQLPETVVEQPPLTPVTSDPVTVPPTLDLPPSSASSSSLEPAPTVPAPAVPVPTAPAVELPTPVVPTPVVPAVELPAGEVDSNIGKSVIAEEFQLQPLFSDERADDQSADDQLSVVPEAAEFEEFPAEPTAVSGVGAFNRVTGPKLPTPVRNLLRGAESRLAGKNGVHAVGQLTFVSLSRDYRGKGRILSNGAPNLLANGPDEGDFTGVDLSYGQRRAGGQGWEMRYFGFNPDEATDVAGSSPSLVWGGITPPLNDPATWGGAIPTGVPETFGLSGIGLGIYSMGELFDDAGNHRVSRDSEFGSFEFNFLRASAGGRRLSCGNAMVEFFGGLRGVSFKETTTFTARALQSASFPRSAFYASEVQNSLFGLQIGGRLERQRKNGWSTSFGSRVGIYNNRVESRQHAEYQFADGSTAVPQVRFGSEAGREFDYEGKDNELAFLGELDLGLIYQFRPQTRARFGYRGIAVTNIADSAGQMEDSLYNGDKVAEPKAWGDLIVGGFYFGVDHAF